MEGSGRCLIDLCVQTKSSILLETVFFPFSFHSFLLLFVLFWGSSFSMAAVLTELPHTRKWPLLGGPSSSEPIEYHRSFLWNKPPENSSVRLTLYSIPGIHTGVSVSNLWTKYSFFSPTKIEWGEISRCNIDSYVGKMPRFNIGPLVAVR